MSLNFPLILFCLMIATGAIWLTDLAVFRRARIAGAEAALRNFDHQFGLAGNVPAPIDANQAREQREALRARLLRAPTWIEMPAGFFPVLLAVFLIRSFLFEPFRIPSGSMMPTLEVGDFILVNKFAYGLRLPIVNKDVVALGRPQRGDVVVFRYPLDPSENYVKRLVGLPGDTIVYRDKHLTINGKPVAIAGSSDYFDAERAAYVKRSVEKLPGASGDIAHNVLLDAHRSDVSRPMVRFPFIDQCTYAVDGAVTCTVPQDQYFMMGDNRDNSADSRYWGFVPDENLVGRAMFVWMNFGSPTRIGGLH
jgi:signal peptidase I